MKKKDYSKCPNCGEQIYMYIGNTEKDQYECYSIDSKGEHAEQIEILAGSRMDRVDYIEDKTIYTCDLGLAQGVDDEFESSACGETTYNSLQELKYSVDYYSIIERKQEADDLSIQSEKEEISIPSDWVAKNIAKQSLEDEEFARWALKIDGLLLEHFSGEIKANLDIVTLALENNVNSSRYIDKKLLDTGKNILHFLDVSSDFLSAVEVSSDLFSDKQFIDDCISKNGNIVLVNSFPKKFLKDKAILTSALVSAQDHEQLINGMPDEIRNDLTFWLDLKKNEDFNSWGYIYEFLPESVKENSEIFKLAVNDDHAVILQAPKSFQNKDNLMDIIQQKIDDENIIDGAVIELAKNIGDSSLNQLIEKVYKLELVI
jgi:hypothetical protein